MFNNDRCLLQIRWQDGQVMTMETMIGSGELLPLIEAQLVGLREGESWTGLAPDTEEGTLEITLLKRLTSTSNSSTSNSNAPTILNQAAQKKEEGNIHFQNRRFQAAVDVYAEGVALLQHPIPFCSPLQEESKEELLCILRLNMASSLLQLKKASEALKILTLVLEGDPDSPKANFRAGKAQQLLNNFDSARNHFNKVLSITPGDTTTLSALSQINEAQRQSEKKQSEFYGKMFS